MITDMIWLSCNGSTNPAGVTITVTVDNGTFVIGGSSLGGGADNVFWGVAPGFEGNYPLTSVQTADTQVQYGGNINNVYGEVYVQSSENFLTGTLAADPPLPVEVTIGSSGSGGSASLSANTASTPFNIPIADFPSEMAAQNRRARRVQPGS
jgi:hypothetical protein